MPIRAVLIDLDNTLILEDERTLEAVGAVAGVARDRRGIDASALGTAVVEHADRAWRTSPVFADADAFGVWWGEALWGGFSGDAPVARALREFVPRFRAGVWRDALDAVGVSDAALADDLGGEFIRIRREREAIDPEAEPVLAALAAARTLALLTNGAGDVQREKLSRTPFARYFTDVVISLEVGVGKPDRRIFEVAAERVGAAAAEAVMVGDSLVRDVAGAHAAGMRAVWLDRGLWDERGPRADATIARLSDLPAALDALERRPASARGTP